MEEIIQARFNQIVPGEGWVEPRKLRDIIKLGESRKILPVPAKTSCEKYLHLDGRHRLIYQYLRGDEEVDLYLSESRTDYMTEEMFPGVDCDTLSFNNRYIRSR